MADPARHPRERRLRAVSNAIMTMMVFAWAASTVAAFILLPVLLAIVAMLVGGALFGVVVFRTTVDPTRPRTAAALVADAAENPDRREAALPYGATLDRDQRIVFPWVRWKRVAWTAFLVMTLYFTAYGFLADNPAPASTRAIFIGLSLCLALRQRRYLRPGLVLDDDGLWQPYTGARVDWQDIDQVLMIRGHRAPWDWLRVRGRPRTVRRPLWGRVRRRIFIPVDALYIDGRELEALLGDARYTIASPAHSSAAAPK